MCMDCDGSGRDEQWAWVKNKIYQTGWCVIPVEGEDERNPEYAYTMGLARRGHPELIVFGMHWQCAHVALEPVARAVLAGRVFDEGDDVSGLFPAGWPVPQLLRFPDSSTHLLWANAMFRRPGMPPIPALHLLWPSEVPLLTGGEPCPR